jgi:hypothetical protein
MQLARCNACGRPLRTPWLIVAGRAYGPQCGRPLLVKVPRARRRDAGQARGPRKDPRQNDLFGAAS